ncbi:MAG: serine/threonine-protein kinase, partial [Thermodesulfobacteriota bacterium]
AHPNIVYVYDASIETDRCYIVMEYVDGPTLKDFCQKDRLLPVETVVKVIYQCTKALDYAHKKGVVHRDIKPSNIMISKKKEVAKIADFGIAAIEGTTLGKPGEATFSLFYSSPEQLAKKELTGQSDLFSLGVAMYELLTGVRPFDAETEVGIFWKITKEDPKPLRQLRPDLPESLDRIISRVLQKDLDKRYKTGQQLAWELSAYFDHLNQQADETTNQEKHHALKRLEFFREFTGPELDEVIGVTQWVTYEPGAAIITEGAMDDCFYIVVSGGVRVTKGGKVLADLRSGDSFGEMAYLGKTSRTADVSAVGHTVLLRVNPTVIDQTTTNTQLRFFKVFTGILIQRLAQTSKLYALGE